MPERVLANSKRPTALWLWLPVLLIAYLATGMLGLQAAATSPHATLLWPPAGIAIAAAILLGRPALPVIWFGAFLLNLAISYRIGRTDPMLFVQGGTIATGNMLEAAAAAWIVHRLRIARDLASFRAVVGFLIAAALLGPAISATVGAKAVQWMAVSAAPPFRVVWPIWFLGNALCAVTLGAAIVACVAGRAWATTPWSRKLEFAAMLLVLGATSYFAFLDSGEPGSGFELAYLPLPAILWAAVRMTPCGAAWASTMLTTAAVTGAVLERGLFKGAAQGSGPEMVFAMYMVVVSATALLVAGLVTERQRATEALAEREERYRALTAATNDAVYDWDMQTGSLWWGEGMRRLFGHDAVRPDLDWWESCIHPDDRAVVMSDLQRAIDQGDRTWESEYRFRRGDGRYAQVLDRGSFVLNPLGRPVRMLGGMTDITLRREAERATQETEERLATTIDTAHVGAFDWDLVTGRVVWSGHHERLWGYEPGEFDGTYDAFRVRVHPADIGALEQKVERCRERRELFEHEFRVRPPDGSVRWVRGRGRFMYAPDGAAMRMLGVVVDVSDVRDAEQAMGRALERERLIANALNIVLWEVDPRTFQFTYVSEEGEALLGYSVEEWKQPGFWQESLHEDDRDWAKKFCYDATMRGEGHEFEYRMRRKDGSIVWVRDSVAVEVVDGKPVHMSGVLVETTKLKQAEQAVERSRRAVRSVIDNSPLAYIEWTPQFEVRAWAGQAEQIFGWSAEEIVGTSLKDWRFVHEADEAPVREVIQRLLSGEHRGVICQNRNYHKSGRVLHCEWYNWSVADEHANIISVHSLVQDVSERTRAEQRQAFMMQELDHRVKNNLAAILSLADATARASDSLSTFRDSFTGRLRAMARTHALLAQSRWSGVRMGDLVRETLEPYSDPSGPRVVVDGPNALLPPRASTPLCMALHELATNAIKYGALSLSSGVVTVRWSVEGDADAPTRLELTWEERGGPAVGEVKRRGFGTSLITDAIMHEFGGETSIRFEPDGLRCHIVAPLEHVTEPAGPETHPPPVLQEPRP